MSAPHLPNELHEYIVDFAHADPKTLKACSLVSRSLVNAARTHLYADLEISFTPPPLWTAHIHLIKFIRKVAIFGTFAKDPGWIARYPVEFWEALPRKLDSFGITGMKWPGIPAHIQDCLLSLDAKSVRISNNVLIPYLFICTFPSVQRVRYDAVVAAPMGLDSLPAPDNAGAIHPVSLQLHAKDASMWTTSSFIDFGGLQVLDLDMTRCMSVVPYVRLLEATAPIIKHFRLRALANEQHADETSNACNLARFLQLESLVIDWSAMEGTSKHLLSILSTIPPDSSIRTIGFHCQPFQLEQGPLSNIQRIQRIDWAKVDAILSNTLRLPRLQTVSVGIYLLNAQDQEGQSRGVAEWLYSEMLLGTQRRSQLEIDLFLYPGKIDRFVPEAGP